METLLTQRNTLVAQTIGQVLGYTTAFIFTSIELLLLDQSNKTSWVFPALKWTSHFLPQFTVSRRSNSSSEAKSSCCHINSSFKLVLERKTGKEIPEASRLEFLEVFSKQFCFIGGRRQHLWTIEFTDCMTDLLLLRTISVIHQKSREPSFWKLMDSFVLLPYASFHSLSFKLKKRLGADWVGLFYYWGDIPWDNIF